MAGERERPEDQLEELLSGGGAAQAGAPHTEETGELTNLRDVAGEMRELRASIPASEGTGAFAAMLSELETARMTDKQGGLTAMIAACWKKPVLRTGAAVTAAVLVLGGASLGAAAATGNEPVRSFLGISSSSTIKVELTGTVVFVNGSVVEVSANGDVRTVVIDANTELTRSGGDDTPLALEEIVVGQIVEIHGRLEADNSILATRFHVEDAEDGIGGTPTVAAPTEAVPTVDATAAPATPEATAPSAQPTVDDDGQGDDHGGDQDDQGDNSGSDNDEADDNSGPGSGDDDATDDNSGSDSGDDDEADDNSGSDSGNDDASDDSGSDSDDDAGDDDHSGSGGGEDAGSDDSSGSGSSGEDH